MKPSDFVLMKLEWMRPVRAALAFALALLAGGGGVASSAPERQVEEVGARRNILLFLVDDLKPALGCYGDAAAKTPCMDALAARGMRFDLAYCNQAVCAPSRFTLMLGSRSTSSGLYGLGSRLRDALPDAVTLPQHFAEHGYRTESLGKVFHIGHGNGGDPASFEVPHFHDKVIEYLDPASTGGGRLTREEALFTNQRLGEIRSLPRGAAWESPEVEDAEYADGRVAEETVRRLRAAKGRREEDGTPFFIVAGFVRPHLPFSAPKKYWDLHDPATLPMPAFEDLPKDAPGVAGKRGGEIAAYAPVPEAGNAVFPEELKRSLVHGYYASTSYVDAQIGKVTAELDALGLAEDTVVVLWGDHGFHLGDLGIWTKHTNYEQANRIPLVIVAPGVAAPGSATRQLAETVDIYPTLAELAGLPAPRGPQKIDGISLVPVLRDPGVRVRDHAYHAYPKAKLGRAIRTERYRMVEWKRPGADAGTAEYELYDYGSDPSETRNLAREKPKVLEEMRAVLARHPEAVWENDRRPTSKPQPPNPNTQRPTDAASASGGGKSGGGTRRPNIVTVFVDDMGWSDVSCFGGKEVETENIDRLAAEGIKFTSFYVNSPICSPSRVAMTTGQYPQRWRITSYLDNRQANRKRGLAQWLDPAAPVLARELRRGGYATGHFGKWHMGGQRDVADAPAIARYGFDRSLTNFEGMGAKLLPLTLTPESERPGRIWENAEILGGPVTWMQRSGITGGFVAAAREFIGQAGRAGKPFFLNLWPDDPHSPFFPPVASWAEGKRGRYYAVLDAMDVQLGPLFDHIRDDENLRANTLILFCSDNGHELGAGRSDPLRGGKTWLYEGGIRSPLIVWGPGLLAEGSAGTVNGTAVFSAIDLNRSLYTLTKTPLPDGHVLDGEDVSGALLGRSEAGRKGALYFRRPPDRPGNDPKWGEGDNPDLAVREGRWKYLVNYDGGDGQLYDLDADISEERDLAGERPDVAGRLHKAVMAWNAALPADAGDPAFKAEEAGKPEGERGGRQ